MMILLDTCFCDHSNELFESDILDIRSLLIQFRCAITDKAKQEITHYGLDKYIMMEDLIVLDTSNIDIKYYQKQNEFLPSLDEPDQLLWILGYIHIKEEYLILTDDSELLLDCQISDINAMKLPTYLLFLCKSNLISKNQVAKCLKFWENIGRYAKRDLKNWRTELQQI